jgi:hypothetical protein
MHKNVSIKGDVLIFFLNAHERCIRDFSIWQQCNIISDVQFIIKTKKNSIYKCPAFITYIVINGFLIFC